MFGLEVDIGVLNSELELTTSKASCLEGLEIGIGNSLQCRTVFRLPKVSPS
jgi:hypothetical protein